MKIIKWKPDTAHRAYPFTQMVECGCRIAPEIKALPSILTQEMTTLSWMEEAVEEALQEDIRHGR